MVKIVVDAMGGDNGSAIVVEAINNFLKDNNNVDNYILAIMSI